VTQDQDRRKAIELLDEAVKRDPAFFDAYCQLAGAHEDLYAVSGSDHTPTRLALAEAALQVATRLRPDAAETHLARAQYLYYGLRDYAGALAELEIARRALPNDPRLFELTGYILRLRGQQEEGLQNLERAVELDPRNLNTLQQISLSYQYLGRYAEAIAALDRVLAIVPDNVETRANRAEYELLWKADIRPLHQTIDAILAQGPGAIARAASSWFDCALAERDPAAVERALVAVGDNPCWGDGTILLSRSFGEGLLARMTKDEARARTAFEAARAQQEKIVQGQPDYGPTLCVLGLIDAALGQKDLALDEGRRAIALMPVEKDVKNGKSRPSIFRDNSSVGGREGACLAATGNWAACSPSIAHAELRRPKTAPFLGSAPRRSALRKSRRLARAERRTRTMKIDNFFSELKRRNVYKVAVAYAVVGWLLVQITTQVFPIFEIPNWAMRLIVLAIIIGFPISLVIAWAFELTPEGLKRTEDADLAAQTRTKPHAWIYVVIVGALLSVGLFFIGRYAAQNNTGAVRTESPGKSIAVLPFDNATRNADTEYLSDGISEALINSLSELPQLKIIARSTAFDTKENRSIRRASDGI